MLVEGGYLDSMKRLLEKAAQTPDPQAPRWTPSEPPEAEPGVIGRSLKKLAKVLTPSSR